MLLLRCDIYKGYDLKLTKAVLLIDLPQITEKDLDCVNNSVRDTTNINSKVARLYNKTIFASCQNQVCCSLVLVFTSEWPVQNIHTHFMWTILFFTFFSFAENKTATSSQIVISFSERFRLHLAHSWGQSESWISAWTIQLEITSCTGTFKCQIPQSPLQPELFQLPFPPWLFFILLQM